MLASGIGIGVCASVDVSDVLASVTVIEVLASVIGIGVCASVDVSDVLVSVTVIEVLASGLALACVRQWMSVTCWRQ